MGWVGVWVGLGSNAIQTIDNDQNSTYKTGLTCAYIDVFDFGNAFI